jgi:Flp pilus assembly protein TadG
MEDKTDKRVRKDAKKKSGHAVIEASLLAPWIFFLFVGVFDFGFYSYAAIATQNAARIAAMQTSDNTKTSADDVLACQYAVQELQMLPGIPKVTSLASTPACPTATGGITNTFPLSVDAQSVTGPDGAPATRVAVTYRTVQLVPIPGLLTGRLQLTRVVEMRLKES